MCLVSIRERKKCIFKVFCWFWCLDCIWDKLVDIRGWAPFSDYHEWQIKSGSWILHPERTQRSRQPSEKVCKCNNTLLHRKPSYEWHSNHLYEQLKKCLHNRARKINLVKCCRILLILFIVRHSWELIITFPVCCWWQDAGNLPENWNWTSSFRLAKVPKLDTLLDFFLQ